MQQQQRRHCRARGLVWGHQVKPPEATAGAGTHEQSWAPEPGLGAARRCWAALGGSPGLWLY